MAVNDLYQVTTQVRTAEGIMSFHFGYLMEAGLIGPSTLNALAFFFATNRLDKYVLACSTDIEVDNVEARAITNDDDIPGSGNLNNLEGVLLGESLPNNSAAVISLKTTAPNAKHNGRMYLPGTPEDVQNDGVLQAGQITLWQAFATVLELDIVGMPGESAEFTPVVISRFLNGVKRTPPVGFNLFVIQGLTGEPIMKIARFAMPFFFLMLLTTAILTLFPEIALYLPKLMAAK